MRLAWATDIHLDHCDAATQQDFIQCIQDASADALCLTGDLSDGPQIQGHLEQLAQALELPIYFVLGNHDYYHRSLAEVRREMRELSRSSRFLHWMPVSGVIPLNASTAIVGHDAWGDGLHGDVYKSWIKMSDFRLIQELKEASEIGVEERVALLQHLGQEAADYLGQLLPEALEQYEKLVLLLHPPPYREACLYGAEVADDHWAPYFTCKAVGDLLDALLPHYPHCSVTVLAGHTHNVCDLQLRANLRVLVGAAEYEKPRLERVLSFI